MISKSNDIPTMVIDVTYKCNATCKYCQWGGHANSPKHLSLEEICLSAETISALGIKRIVLSGGEPSLHPEISKIIAYYKRMVDSVVVISNGYGLADEEITRFINNGATGLAVSLDSIDPNEAMLVRGTPPGIHHQIITNLKTFGKRKGDFELGINTVVSHVTANWKTVRDLLEFSKNINANYVKFQPIFDDGYVAANAPDLMLNVTDAQELDRIGALLETCDHPLTNPSGFWKNLADLATGKVLSPKSCNISRKAIAIRNNLSICYWLNTSSFGNTTDKLEIGDFLSTKKRFEDAKTKCKVDFHCFCSQGILHIWENQGSTK